MMALDSAMRLTEILVALAFLQQCAEHIFGSRGSRLLFTPRAILSLLLLAGSHSQWVLLALSAHSLLVLHRYQGPYNGGSDRMGLLVLYCLSLARWMPDGIATEAAFGYLGLQVVLSYFISGQVKIVNPEWRSGRALQDVFSFSAYPVAQSLRALSLRPRLLWAASWAVILFELAFPLSLFSPVALTLALLIAASFHVANACLFGLNRFVWFWISAYPSILWLQGRLVAQI
ncbi:HTTM domain-containing protein [Sulfitobacter donghicola]|uniref:HTTM domain protein n=1 Tax=Sulfitobacter donghicola DSW-25 = KCTC 12864 = JCM 14565 TaxID=1300350 RepID=A0A073IDD4_9RHOB|nr:HTTM domain-containing protein [Sulfitobacter donghicola]KEJ87754.1 HTTM domain protein [Sulfitobacter donghicola DSW-25 = KCTC 12864 = JCM 14565]KIN66521.1 HTTM domain protein [Sulfitobacter donghicola DSW-25 = KCTC 12864 = JCM 14565]